MLRSRDTLPMFTVITADAPDVDIARFRPLIERARLRVAADGGARYFMTLGVQPHLVIGDLDSLSAQSLAALEQQGVCIERHPAEKQETDLELALLRALELGATRIVVLAALGGRPDQHLANLLLLAHPQLRNRQISLLDGNWEVRLVHGATDIYGQPGNLISLVPIGTAEGITTQGLYYPLNDEALVLGPARGVSNVLLSEQARVTVRQGMLLLFHCHGDSAVAGPTA